MAEPVNEYCEATVNPVDEVVMVLLRFENVLKASGELVKIGYSVYGGL